MIEIKELRLGNLILRLSGDTWVSTKVNLTYLSLINDYPEDYKPILLSEELLFKFGFEFDVDYTLYKKSFIISFEKSGNDLCCYLEAVAIDIKYIHQLQNLYFSLTNEELLINNTL